MGRIVIGPLTLSMVVSNELPISGIVELES
jgi:hypothetical protein